LPGYMQRRIHIFGASGAGTTTLGQALSERFGIPHFDSDSYFWLKTDIPFTKKRNIPERVERLERDLNRYPEWVLSGSLVDWGDFAIPLFTLAVFLRIPHDLRMERIKAREIERYGLGAISPGGWFYENHLAFMDYASAYDSAGLDVDIRSIKLHEKWMQKLSCGILRIEEPLPVQALVARVEQELIAIDRGV
jgi:adenylate kinase family enzyme